MGRCTPRDVMCQDGVMDYGWRLVRSPGRVKAYSSWWESEKLIPFIGQYVVVNSEDFWCTAVNIYRNYPSGTFKSDFIVKIKS